MHKLIKYFFFAVFALANVTGYTQYIGTDDEVAVKKQRKPKKETNRIKNKKAVIKAIKDLKNGGAVLYMIRDKKLNAAMLKEKGYEELVVKREEEAKRKNMFMVRSLAKKFTFCPIYFFYQSDLEKIQQGQIQGNLLDTNLVKQPDVTFNHAYFLVLDYGDVYPETEKVYSDTGKADITGKMAMKENSFVFKNKYLSQLTHPFPFFQRCEFPFKEIFVKIRRMNKRLNKFYQKYSEQ